MQPVIPKVQVGDILLSTRHLRQWLRSLSLALRLEDIAVGRKPSLDICAPSKDDQHLVIVNRQPTFVTWSRKLNATLVFRARPRRNGDTRLKGYEGLGISPLNFAHWFIRSPNREVSTADWTDHAYALWVTLHHGAFTSIPPWLVYGPTDYRRVFSFHKQNIGSRLSWTGAMQSLGTGHRRASDVLHELEPQGPCRNDHVRFQKRMRDLLEQPRVKAYFATDVNSELAEYKKELD